MNGGVEVKQGVVFVVRGLQLPLVYCNGSIGPFGDGGLN